MKYTYFPGCSLKAASVAYDLSTQAVGRALGMQLLELEDWNCCGATAYSSINERLAFCISGRNLALAERTGMDLVAPCSACYTVLRKTDTYMKEWPRLRADVNEALAAAGLRYEGGVKVRHLLEVILNDIGPDTIEARVQRPLEGLKVAPYYGCQLVRPRLGFDHPEFPMSLDYLMESLGAEVVNFPLKSRCCGGALIVSRENLAGNLIHKILRCAFENGAQCIVTVCPLCQTNLDVYQDRINRRFRTDYRLPVLYFTQLLGLAFGIAPRDLALESSFVSPKQALAAYV